jgi:hypothetical protein
MHVTETTSTEATETDLADILTECGNLAVACAAGARADGPQAAPHGAGMHELEIAVAQTREAVARDVECREALERLLSAQDGLRETLA